MIAIKAEKRSKLGSFFSQDCRKQNKIPANFYGKNIDNMNLLVRPEDIIKVQSQKKYRIMELEIDGKTIEVLLQDVQFHPVSMSPLHVDFLAVQKDQEINVDVPIRYTNIGKCVGLKQGGFLNKIYRHFPVKCLPKNIPAEIEIDVTNFNIGKIIKVSDLDLPKEVQPLRSDNVVVCNIIGRAKKQQTETSEKGANQK